MVNLVRRWLRRASVPIALSASLMLLMFSVYGGETFAAQRSAEESRLEALVTDVDAFWEREFAGYGYPYSPPSWGLHTTNP